MLNKNQSKKRNSLKYALILPVLVAFVIFFQVRVVAQEQKYANKTEIIETTQVVICKTSTDDYIKESCKRIKKMHNIDLKFFKIQRNAKGEIFSIEGTFDDNKGTNGDYRQSRDTPIGTIKFLVKKGKNGNEEIGFRNADEEDIIEDEDFVSNIAPIAPEEPMVPIASEVPEAPVAPTFPDGPIPVAPAPDMSKMPTPPIYPLNMNDKKAMKKFEKKMAEYEKKMESFEPDMTEYEKQIEKEMAKREAVFEIEMEKYEEAMQSRREAIESRKEAIEARKEAMKERKKAREEAEKEKN